MKFVLRQDAVKEEIRKAGVFMDGPAVGVVFRKLDLAKPPARPSNFPATQSAARPPALRSFTGQDFKRILLLMVVVFVLRAWLIGHTAVAARDSIGFIRYALLLESSPLQDGLRNSLQHPGYPAILLAVSWPVRFFMGTTPMSMQLSAQLASSLASILLVIPMYYLGRELFDRTAGFWGTALFQCLPVSSHVMSDALSEASFLLFMTTALLLAALALRSSSVWKFVLCGCFSGLAYLVRPEGALAVVAVGMVLLGMQLHGAWRRSWSRVCVCGLSLVIGAVAVGGPYVWVIGGFTNKPTPKEILKSAMLDDAEQSKDRPGAVAAGVERPLLASVFAVYAPEGLKDRRWWGLQAIATEVIRGYQYLAGLPVLLGLFWFRDRLRLIPGAWAILVLCLLHVFVLWRLAMAVGYVSERHVLLLIMCGAFSGAAMTALVGQRLSQALYGQPTVWPSVALLLVLTGFGIPETLKPLHANRAGHRAAGLWLAEHTIPADPIEDPFCWAHYYAGRVFWEGKTIPQPEGYRPTQYAVLEQSDHEHSRLPTIARAQDLASRGQAVYWWPENVPEAQAKVCVYALR
jgi:4-amino-4-deoxy-L-arabinose transferase-like glycosyltransferase